MPVHALAMYAPRKSWPFPLAGPGGAKDRVDDFHVGLGVFERNGNFAIVADSAGENITLNRVLVACRNLYNFHLAVIDRHSIRDCNVRWAVGWRIKRYFNRETAGSSENFHALIM